MVEAYTFDSRSKILEPIPNSIEAQVEMPDVPDGKLLRLAQQIVSEFQNTSPREVLCQVRMGTAVDSRFFPFGTVLDITLSGDTGDKESLFRGIICGPENGSCIISFPEVMQQDQQEFNFDLPVFHRGVLRTGKDIKEIQIYA